MIFPCEKAVWYNLPQIRADLAIELVKTGMTQSQAAKLLGVTPAAVSQYIHRKRGLQVVKTKVYRQEIKIAAKKLQEEVAPEELRFMVCKCCQILSRESGEGQAVCGPE